MFCYQCFTISVTVIHLWHDDRALSKNVCSTIPIPLYDLKVKVTDWIFCVKFLQCQFLQSLWLSWIVFGMNEYKILKCFRKEKRDFRRAALSDDRSYYQIFIKLAGNEDKDKISDELEIWLGLTIPFWIIRLRFPKTFPLTCNGENVVFCLACSVFSKIKR